jgi:TM2 domain-containing membrane protein YozV
MGTKQGVGVLTTQDKILIEQRVANDKPSMATAYVLGVFLGLFGAHRFYLDRTGSGIAMLILSFTVIGLIITIPWHAIDWFLIAGWVREKMETLRRDYTMQALADAPATQQPATA